MAVTTTETYGRWTFDLERDDEKTTRTISIPNPKDPVQDEQAIQDAVDNLNASIASGQGTWDSFIQPANWRDNNVTEEQWTTTKATYEVISTSKTPFEP